MTSKVRANWEQLLRALHKLADASPVFYVTTHLVENIDASATVILPTYVNEPPHEVIDLYMFFYLNSTMVFIV